MFGFAPFLFALPAAPQTATAVKADSTVDVVDLSQPGALSLRGAQIVGTPSPAARGLGPAAVATVRFGGRATWLYQTFDQTQDWTGVHLVTVTLRNEESFPVTFGAAISSSTNPADLSAAFNAPITLAANETKRFALVLREPDFAGAGLRALPAPSGAPCTFVRSVTAADPSRIGHWRLSYQGTNPARVTVAEIGRVAYAPGFANLADAYGQFTSRDWDGKILDPADFAVRRVNEAADLARNPAVASLYGSSTLPKQSVGSVWKTAKINNRKYLITPSGKPFWMTGLVGVNDWRSTMIDGREAMFASLPSRSGADADLFVRHIPNRGAPGTMVVIQRHNLRQKYGQNYAAPFVATLRQRLPSWGFNTIGSESLDALDDDSAPFTLTLSTEAFPTRLATPQLAWHPLPDPYDAGFQNWSATQFIARLGPKKTMRNLVGTFVDNELSWGEVTAAMPDGDLSVAVGALRAPAAQPARQALIAALVKKYANKIARLNAAWGTQYAAFGAVDASKLANGARPNSAMRTDLKTFVGGFAGTYFTKVKAALTTAGYRGLYLGCRFGQSNDAAVAACAKSADILSFNFYRRAADMPWAALNALAKPVLISEFGIAHADGSGFAGQPLASSGDERAAWVDAWLRTAAAQPNVVGIQYFAFGENPVTGDADNQENYSYGLVDIADTPDPKLVGVFRQFAKDLFTIRR